MRDISLAHVLSLQKEELAGERVIVATPEPYKAIEWGMPSTLLANCTCSAPSFYSVVIAHKMNPRLPAGEHDLDLSNIKYDYKFDVSKGQKIFGIKLRTKEETTRDILAQIKDEWLP